MKVSILENQYGTCKPDGELVYPGVNSCLTVTALFKDGYRTGAHLTQVDADGGDGWKNVFQQWLDNTKHKLVKDKHGAIATVFVLGDLGWPDEDEQEIMTGIAQLGAQFAKGAKSGALQVETMHGDIYVGREGTVSVS